ncbi:hypothetical protein [Candidatus Parabeggiatoa sp. HSG14]|uniref:hypothetical protein n=1 Tax=Candidatus Parabeggiatoa sp. HSG14 TaxID=3055593 RepID=UPI0025A8B975|nr:hypothetical protein [Thiotrichales bacterium HSG14]
MMKKIIGKIVVALIKALVRAFFGMFVGAALVGLVVIMLLFFGALTPDAGNDAMVLEIFSLLLIGGAIGAIVGFFDMLDMSSKASKASNQRQHLENAGNGYSVSHQSGQTDKMGFKVSDKREHFGSIGNSWRDNNRKKTGQ